MLAGTFGPAQKKKIATPTPADIKNNNKKAESNNIIAQSSRK